MSHNHHDNHCCGHHSAAPSLTQTLDEMDFERGVWSSALDGDHSKVKGHLASGVDPNSVDGSGYTALHYAARNGHLDVCKLLLDHGAKVNAQTRSGGVTPLHRAAYCGHQDVLELLLQRGAKVSALDSDGKTALHKAAEKGRISIATRLLQSDPSVRLYKDNHDRTALDCSPENVRPDLAIVLGKT